MLRGIQAACQQASARTPLLASQCTARAYVRLLPAPEASVGSSDRRPCHAKQHAVWGACKLQGTGCQVQPDELPLCDVVPLLPLQIKDAAYAHEQLGKCEEHTHTLRTQLQQVTAERDSEHHLRQQAEACTAPQHSLPQLAEHLARVQQVSALSKLWRCFCKAAMVH